MSHPETRRSAHGDGGAEAGRSPIYLERARWLGRLRELSAPRRDERTSATGRPADEALDPAARAAPSEPWR